MGIHRGGHTWVFEAPNVVVLHDDMTPPAAYNRESLEQVIRNVEKERSAYATEAAYNHRLNIYKEGLKFLISQVSNG